MPRPVNLPQSGSGRIFRAAGTENMADVRTPISTGRHNAQRGREPSSTYQSSSGRHTPQTATTADETPTSHGQETGNRAAAPTQTDNPGRTEPEVTTDPRLRNTPRATLTQPRRQRQSTRVASLNMNGIGSKTDDKWSAINNVMKKRKISVLAIQETHPTEEAQRTVERRFRNSLQVYHSADPDEPGSRNGVSIALNKRLVKTANVTTRTLVEGRVIMIEIPWNVVIELVF